MSYVLPFEPTDKLIELGGGATPTLRHLGVPNADVRAGPTVDVVWDFNQPAPLPDATYDGLYAQYALEHVSWRRCPGFLQETARLLKPGGVAVFLVPNTYEQAKKLVADYPRWSNAHQSMLWGDLDYTENSHKMALGPEYAQALFLANGYFAVEVVPHPACATDMIITARKSAAVIWRSLAEAAR